MKRPNSLDWFIYKIFQKWWNPILKRNRPLGLAFVYCMEDWYRRQKNQNDNSDNTIK